jgi:hypothetical protein
LVKSSVCSIKRRKKDDVVGGTHLGAPELDAEPPRGVSHNDARSHCV